MRERLAKVHQRGDDGTLQPIEFEVPQEPECGNGGRRALLDRTRLLEVRADDPQSRKSAARVRYSNPRQWI